MARAACKKCGIHPKAPAHPLYCAECLALTLPIDEQVRIAKVRKSFLRAEDSPVRVKAEECPEGRRWCSGCRSFVRLTDVPKNASRCRACASEASHASQVQATYGITGEQYAALYAAQKGVCYLCKRAPKNRRLAVDHNHETGEVRGLLCGGTEFSCNLIVIGTMESISRDGALNMARRIVRYFSDPPARSVLTRSE